MPNFRLSAFADEASPDFASQLAALRRHGISLLEIRGVNGKNVSALTNEEAREARRMMDDAGVKLSALGSPYGKYPIEQDFAPHLDDFKRGLELCDILGADKIRMFSFYTPKEDHPEWWRGKVVYQLGMMINLAQEAGITLCHENEKGIYGDTDARCMNLLNAFPQLGCVFDPANFIQCGVDVPSAFDKMQSRITYMHVKDAIKATGAVVPAGCGDGQFPALLEKLAAMGQDMVLTLEPHLTVFDGLAGLQDEQLVHAFTYPDAGTAFDAAVEAVKGLMGEIRNSEFGMRN